MQILGAAGKSGSGKTTLIRHIAASLVERDYGLPRLLHFGSGPLDLMETALQIAWHDEQIGKVGTRGEIIILIDDVHYPVQVELIHHWGGSVLFVCADGRLTDLTAAHRRIPSERMANSYSARRSHEFFDFVLTNHHTEDRFLAEADKFMHTFLGGDASYEAGLM